MMPEEYVALQEQARKAELIEASAGWGTTVDRNEYLYDDSSFGYSLAVPYTTIDDRRGGAFRPIYYTEQDLSMIRAQVRNLWGLTPIPSGVIDTLANYTFGEGIGYTVQAEIDSPQLLTAMQKVVDEFSESHGLDGDLDREIHRRSREDGEAFVRLRWVNGKVRATCVEADQIGEPGDARSVEYECELDAGGCWKFGVHTLADDTSEVLGFFMRHDSSGAEWEYLPSNRCEHFKRNVTASAKRGFSDFYDIIKDLYNESRLTGNATAGAALQAAIAWIRQVPAGTTQSQATDIGRNAATRTASSPAAGGGNRLSNVGRYAPNTVLTIPQGQEYLPGPLGAERNAGFDLIGQRVLKRCGVRWGMPEGMISGDSSNNNYASALVAQSPFVKGRQADQIWYGKRTISLLWKVIRMAWENGRFDRYHVNIDQMREHCKIVASYPTVESIDPLEQTNVAEKRIAMGILSKTTAAKQAGLDLEEEIRLGANEPPPPMIPPGFGQPGGVPPNGVPAVDPNAADEQAQQQLGKLIAGGLPESHCGNDMQRAVAIALESVASTDEARAVLSQLQEADGTRWVTIDEHPVPIEDGEVALGKMADRKNRAMKSAKKPEHLGDLSQYSKDDLFNWVNYQGGKEWIDSHGDADSKYRAMSKLSGEWDNAVRAKEKAAKPTRREMTKEEAADKLKKGFLVSPGIMKKYPELEALVNPIHKMEPKIRDVTPEGYGPGKPTPDSVEAFPHGQERHQTTEEQSLRRSIADAQTILKGKVSGDKRAAVEKSLKDSTEKLSKIVRESENNG